eukprot:SM000077S21579  [mRNA]  locus=s77:294879:298669:+ [translate_table: standard]
MARGVLADETHVDGHADALLRRRAVAEVRPGHRRDLILLGIPSRVATIELTEPALLQVGLLVGRVGEASRDFVFALVPTPPKDAETAASQPPDAPGKGRAAASKKSAPAAGLVVDEDWVAEHARQVARMLLGGMRVVGIYAFSTDAAFKAATAVLWQAVKGVAAATGSLLGASMDPLLLHICSSPKKYSTTCHCSASCNKASRTHSSSFRSLMQSPEILWALPSPPLGMWPIRYTLRRCTLDAPFASSLKPSELKFGKTLSQLHAFVTEHAVQINLPITEGLRQEQAPALRAAAEAAIQREQASLASAMALVDGTLAVPDSSLGVGNTSNAPHKVEMLMPLSQTASTEGGDGRQALGVLSMEGVVHARAYASSRETLQRALADLRADIITSLRSRLDLLCDEAEAAVEEEEEEHTAATDSQALLGESQPQTTSLLLGTHFAKVSCMWQMPRRVLAVWKDGALVCDYLLRDETLEHARERWAAMLALQPGDLSLPSAILEPEEMAPLPDLSAASLPGTAFAADVSSGVTATSKGVSVARYQCAVAAVGAAAALLLAVAIGAVIAPGAAYLG